MKKREKSAQYMQQYQEIFQCPICMADMKIVDLKSLICTNNHTFDVTKQGYINLLNSSSKTKYNKKLFESRKSIVDSGLFVPLHERISQLIANGVGGEERINILDAGCGEGSHLAYIKDNIDKKLSTDVLGVGIDIAKEGIVVAARNHMDFLWAVGDLAKTPFQEKCFDIVLNILSPANYGEFKRLLKDNSMVVKIIPQRKYLKELREIILEESREESREESYNNESIVKKFKENFRIMERHPLSYIFPLDKSLIPELILMTPLSWSIKEESLQEYLKTDLDHITIDFDILIGKP